jgi:FkbM family methyltransferase
VIHVLGILMEDLWFNDKSDFTKWVVQHGLLRESFVVVDVGVQGGAHPRWNLLGDYLIFHGFDAIAEVIAELKLAGAGRRNRHFHNFAIGDTDGEQNFYINTLNPTSSSMYEQGPSRFENQRSEETRAVPVRRLDTLLADGTLPRGDFLKVDVEGFEKHVFLGAQDFIASGVVGVEAESNFNISPIYPRSHFTTISDMVGSEGLILADIGFNRVPRAAFVRALRRMSIDDHGRYELGRPATLNLLFCRDPIDESDHPQNYVKRPNPLNVDQIIKTMIVYELYGLNDIALDIVERFASSLAARLDVERAVQLLTKIDCLRVTDVAVSPGSLPSHPPLELQLQAAEHELDAMKRSNSWRITAPLRRAASFIRGSGPR